MGGPRTPHIPTLDGGGAWYAGPSEWSTMGMGIGRRIDDRGRISGGPLPSDP
jgi:hypothetical protein